MSLIAGLASAQFPQFPGLEQPTQPWTGPLADHINGQLVRDTPEVAAAKAQHALAHSQVEAILPKLPPEIRYQMTGIVNPVVPQQQPLHIQNQIVPQQRAFVPNQNIVQHPNLVPQTNVQQQAIHTSPQFTQFAEEIPRSPIGEVPEVHAARVAHLAAHNQVRHALPVLPQTTERPVNNNLFGFNNGNLFAQQDTPEVAAARAAHLRALQSAGK